MDLTTELSRIAREVDRARHTLSSVDARIKGERSLPEATAKVTDINKILFDAAESLMDFFDQSLEKQKKGLAIVSDLKKWVKGVGDGKREEGEELIKNVEDVLASTRDGIHNMYPVMGFQDLAGQRLKKLFTELYEIEKTIINIAISTGMDLDDYEQRLLEELNDSSLPMIIRQDRVDEILKKFGV